MKKKIKKVKLKKKAEKSKKKIKTSIKDFGNKGKGRKGKYIYIKEKGKKPKYYKLKDELEEKDYIEAYKRKLYLKRGGVTKKRIKKERKLDKLAKKYPEIESTLKKGLAQTTIRNPEKLTPYGIKTAYMDLLRNKDKAGDGYGIVRDKELLELITRSENIDKWKHRVMFEVNVLNEKGDKVFTVTNSTIKLLGEVKKEVISEIKLGRKAEELIGEGSPKAGDSRNILEEIKKRGYNVLLGETKEGKISNITIKAIFRKGRA